MFPGGKGGWGYFLTPRTRSWQHLSPARHKATPFSHAHFITVRQQVGKGGQNQACFLPHFFEISLCQTLKTLQIQILKFH